MDKVMEEEFVPRINTFIEMHKEARKMHADYIVTLSDWQKSLIHENKNLKAELQVLNKPEAVSDTLFKMLIENQVLKNEDFEGAMTEFRTAYNGYIHDANLALGRLSNHWGGYIESVGVEYLLNMLRKEFQVHTFVQKFKRYWHKSKNIEVDLLALSDDTCFFVEVKNHLKEDLVPKLTTNLEKFREKVPEYGHLKLQPVLFCVHINASVMQNSFLPDDWWVVHYKNFEPEKPKHSFDWLVGGPEPQ